jgi:hypothetical protein
MTEAEHRERGTAVQQLLVLGGLTGFAISQPLLSVLGDNPTTLAFHGVEGWELVGFAALIALGPPVLLWCVVRATSWLSLTAGRAVLLLLVGALVALTTVQVAKAVGLEQRGLLVALSVAVGIAFATAYARVAAVATWAAYTAILPVLAVVFFLAASPASALLTTVSEPDPTASGGDQPSVVMVILDELPTRSLLDGQDQIDRARFPHLAAFADDATWYRHHTSLASQTAAAVPSLLTGMLPTTDPPLASSHPDNLFTLLAPTHELEVLESATQLCPYESCAPTSAASGDTLAATEPGTADMLDLTAEIWVDRVRPGTSSPPQLDDFAEELRPAEDAPAGRSTSDGFLRGDDDLRATSARADALVESFDADKGPALYFLHLLLPHQPWRYHPDGELYGESDPFGLGLAEADKPYQYSWSPWVSAVSEQRHLLQLQYADQLVGQITAALEDTGLYDDSLVVIASDHGVSFEPRTATRSVDASTTDAIAYAPLLVKAPRQGTGAVDDSNLMSIDLVPTVADALGVPLTWEADGAAAGSPAIAARGTTKRIDDFRGLSQMRLEASIEFDDAATFPLVREGFIGPLTDPDDPHSGLVDLLGLEAVIGRRLDDLDPAAPRGVVRIPSLADLRRPSGSPLLAVVTGRVRDAPPTAQVVIAVDGVVVAGSELSVDADGQDGRIFVLLPQGVLGPENEIRAALIDGDQVIELNVE